MIYCGLLWFSAVNKCDNKAMTAVGETYDSTIKTLIKNFQRTSDANI